MHNCGAYKFQYRERQQLTTKERNTDTDKAVKQREIVAE